MGSFVKWLQEIRASLGPQLVPSLSKPSLTKGRGLAVSLSLWTCSLQKFYHADRVKLSCRCLHTPWRNPTYNCQGDGQSLFFNAIPSHRPDRPPLAWPYENGLKTLQWHHYRHIKIHKPYAPTLCPCGSSLLVSNLLVRSHLRWLWSVFCLFAEKVVSGFRIHLPSVRLGDHTTTPKQLKQDAVAPVSTVLYIYIYSRHADIW